MKPIRDPEYRAWIRTFACACGCGRRPTQAAHTGHDGGMGLKPSDDSCIPLWWGCHWLYHWIGKREFERRRGIRIDAIAATHRALYEKCEGRIDVEKIVFADDTPTQVSLKFLEGRKCSSKFTGRQLMFSTDDNKVFFLNEESGILIQNQIRELGVRKGEPVTICKETGNGAIWWRVSRAAGEQADGTYVVPKEAASSSQTSAASTPVSTAATQPSNTHQNNGYDNSPYEHSGFSLRLRQDVNMLVDVMGSCLEYSKKYNGAVRNEDVRSILLTAYINGTKGTRQ